MAWFLTIGNCGRLSVSVASRMVSISPYPLPCNFVTTPCSASGLALKFALANDIVANRSPREVSTRDLHSFLPFAWLTLLAFALLPPPWEHGRANLLGGCEKQMEGSIIKIFKNNAKTSGGRLSYPIIAAETVLIQPACSWLVSGVSEPGQNQHMPTHGLRIDNQVSWFYGSVSGVVC